MSNHDDDDELPVPPPTTLAEAFQQGFTVPEALRMNSVYGKYGSQVLDKRPSPAVGLTILALAIHRARRVMRVV